MSSVTLMQGDCLERMKELDDNSVDSVVTDPPYGLGFMGKKWDVGVPAVDVFVECLRVLKPGGHLLAFGGSRTYHRLAVAVEDAGLDIRDQIMWVYGSGFPKSLNVGKAIDKCNGEAGRLHKFTAWMRTTGLKSSEINRITETNMGGHYLTSASQPAIPTPTLWEKLRPYCGEVPAWVDELVDRIEAEREVVGERTTGIGTGEGSTPIMGDGNRDITAPATEAARQWDGWGTSLKPAHEPVVMARKPLAGTVAANVLAHGTGALNIDGCRVDANGEKTGGNGNIGLQQAKGWNANNMPRKREQQQSTTQGRWPANLLHDGSDEATAGMGAASRYFYQAKASRKDRNEGLDDMPTLSGGEATARKDGSAGTNSPRAGAGRTGGSKNAHPTVKPTDLMRYLCRLVTPPGGVVLDPFMGSGSTGKAAVLEGFRFIGIELDEGYLEIARRRINAARPIDAEDETPYSGLSTTGDTP